MEIREKQGERMTKNIESFIAPHIVLDEVCNRIIKQFPELPDFLALFGANPLNSTYVAEKLRKRGCNVALYRKRPGNNGEIDYINIGDIIKSVIKEAPCGSEIWNMYRFDKFE